MREPMLIAGGYGPEINFYAVDTAECIRSIHFPKGHVNKLVISPDREFLAAAGNPCVRIYPIEGTPGTGTAYEEHTGNVTAVGFGSDNKWFFTAGEDGFIKLWDRREEGRKLPAFYEGSSPIHCCILHPNQAELIFGDHQGRVMIWDIVANKIRQSIEPREASSAVRSVTISSDGRLLVAATDTWNRGTCHAWKHDGAAWQEVGMGLRVYRGRRLCGDRKQRWHVPRVGLSYRRNAPRICAAKEWQGGDGNRFARLLKSPSSIILLVSGAGIAPEQADSPPLARGRRSPRPSPRARGSRIS
eukprot:GEMP01074452.1.p1 GENE.GEMP01074452.1~~GEMP01074452.1.p1  ORF type:complete len:301 (+),score=50.33 GEMP01074452.1:145-1047(+)